MPYTTIAAALMLSACTTATAPPTTSPSPTPEPSALVTVTASPGAFPSPYPSMPPIPPSNLRIEGTFTTRTDPASAGSACSYGEFVPARASYVSQAMAVAGVGAFRLGMELTPTTGSQPAATPTLSYGQKPVGIEETATVASGAILGRWHATSGQVLVQTIQNLGQPGMWGLMSGTVDAWLLDEGGHRPLHMSGSWACLVYPPAG